MLAIIVDWLQSFYNHSKLLLLCIPTWIIQGNYPHHLGNGFLNSSCHFNWFMFDWWIKFIRRNGNVILTPLECFGLCIWLNGVRVESWRSLNLTKHYANTSYIYTMYMCNTCTSPKCGQTVFFRFKGRNDSLMKLSEILSFRIFYFSTTSWIELRNM